MSEQEPLGSERFVWMDVPLSLIVDKMVAARDLSKFNDVAVQLSDKHMRIFPLTEAEPQNGPSFRGATRNEIARRVLAALLLVAPE